MTREDILEKLNKHKDNDVLDVKVAKEMIGLIFDAHEVKAQILVDKIIELTTKSEELKNRTCEGCRFLTGKDKASDCIYGYLPKNLYEDDFSCNTWKKKDV